MVAAMAVMGTMELMAVPGPNSSEMEASFLISSVDKMTTIRLDGGDDYDELEWRRRRRPF